MPRGGGRSKVAMGRQKWFALGAVAVLAAGAGVTVFLIRNRPEPATVRPLPEARLVRTIRLQKEKKTFWVTGYGTVRPKTEVTLVPEVSGRVVRRSPGFRSGGFIKKGELLFQIDPTEYRLAVVQRRAQIAQLEADIARLKQEERNHRADLAIAKRELEVARTELERNRRLRQQGIISQGRLDTSLQAFLRQESAVQTARNALALIPPMLAQKRAALNVTHAQLDEALLNLKRTKYFAPFHARVRQTKLEVGDYARAGEPVGAIHDMRVVEVPVSIPVEEARWAFRRIKGVASFPRSQKEVQRFFPSAEVLWTRFGQTFRWDGRVTLMEAGLDEATRAITLVVEVPEPLKKWVPGVHPPLMAGMFVRVRIRGITVPGVFVIPRAALRAGDRVYVFNNGMLDIRRVEVIRRGQDEVVVRDGLEEGEQVILSAIPDPVPGMMLRRVDVDRGNAEAPRVPSP
ncbi:MAG: efflux RND transporter periplasmic adaptor subunit [Nitrospinota bacterium]